MSFYEGFYFFIFFALISIPAIIMGILEIRIKFYGIIASLTMLYFILDSSEQQIIFAVVYFVYQILLILGIKRYLKVFNRRKYTLIISVFLSILPLAISKLSVMFHGCSLGFIGISYITFKSIQILIEIYDGVINKINVFDTGYFLIFAQTFPAGPITRSRSFIEDSNKKITQSQYLKLLSNGISNIMKGVLYKFVIGFLIFSKMNEYGIDGGLKFNIIYMYLYGFYLFFDFAGYSMMAIGASNIFGLNIPRNFDKPFLAKDINDFWNRWHITLSHWFRDFVFTRLIIYFVKKDIFDSKLSRTCIGFIMNMTLMGVWHGINMSYILYGIYHGVLLSLFEIYKKKLNIHKKYKKNKIYIFISWFITFNLIMFGFFIFSEKFMEIFIRILSR